MGPLLVLVGLALFLFGLGNLIRPSERMRVGSRTRTAILVVASVFLIILGAWITSSAEETTPGAGAGTTFTEPGSTTTLPIASTSDLPTTTTSLSVTSTATTLLPTIPQADVVFAAPSPGPSGDPAASLPTAAEPATVVSITDGDTLDVGLADQTVETVRLIGTNSPEAGECFADEAGLVLGILTPVGSRVGLTVDVSDRDQFDRLLRYVWAGAMSVNEEMVRRGAAIARRYPPDTALAPRLEQAQTDARNEQLGIWEPDACGPDAGTEIRVAAIEADAPGNDNDNLNAEYVLVVNEGEIGVEMSGWTLRDESSTHRYRFPAGFMIGAGATVTVYTGCGIDGATSLYWCSTGAVWNNDGDTAFIVDHNGNIVDSLGYVPPPS